MLRSPAGGPTAAVIALTSQYQEAWVVALTAPDSGQRQVWSRSCLHCALHTGPCSHLMPWASPPRLCPEPGLGPQWSPGDPGPAQVALNLLASLAAATIVMLLDPSRPVSSSAWISLLKCCRFVLCVALHVCGLVCQPSGQCQPVEIPGWL